jgi:hypothetical protein
MFMCCEVVNYPNRFLPCPDPSAAPVAAKPPAPSYTDSSSEEAGAGASGTVDTVFTRLSAAVETQRGAVEAGGDAGAASTQVQNHVHI